MKGFVVPIDGIKLVSPHSKTYAAWCPACFKTIEMITFHEACEIAAAELDDVIKLATVGKLHLGIRPEAVLICLDSLLAANFPAKAKNSPTRTKPEVARRFA